MRPLQVQEYRYLIILIFLLQIISYHPGYSQNELHTPYPIIFIHGINSNYRSCWTDPNKYGILDFLKNGDTPLKDGGNINISLDNKRNTNQLNTNKELDVKLFTTNPIYGDFYEINFDVHATDGDFTRNISDNYYSTVLADLNEDIVPYFTHKFKVSRIDQFRASDIIRIDDEFMKVTNVDNEENELTVERGKLDSKELFHLPIWVPSPFEIGLIQLPYHIYNLSTQSNQASIAKQGWAIKLAIDAIKRSTGAIKVILVGHSMGGLAAREYIQSNYYGEDVAKIVTIGTPHKGSDITDLPNYLQGFKGVDGKSEAVRDLRTLINTTPIPSDPFFLLKKPGVFLNGGIESFISGYYSKDIDCNGNETDLIQGLNEFNYRPFPKNVSKTWIVSTTQTLSFTDDIVLKKNQYIDPKDTIETKGWHLAEPFNKYALLRGLDEPDEPELAYEIGEKSTNKGFITFGPGTPPNPVDIDLYKIVLQEDGLLSINVLGNKFCGVQFISLLGNKFDEKDNNTLKSIHNLSETLEYNAKAGTYYIQIWGIAVDDGPDIPSTYSFPYTLKTNFVKTPPVILASSPDNSMDYYDVVVNNNRDKTIKLTNNGPINISVTDLNTADLNSDQFEIQTPIPFDIAPGESQNIIIRFSPTSSGVKNTNLIITNNSSDTPIKSIALKGTGVDHATMNLVISPEAYYNYGSVYSNNNKNKTFTLQNTGSDKVSVTDLTISGLNPTEYEITSPASTSFDLSSGDVKEIVVKFSPTSVGSKSADLIITNNADNASPTHTISLYGNGKDDVYAGSSISITAYEYWYDDNYASKSYVAVHEQNINYLGALFPTTSLNIGLHTIHIRYKDNKGKWSSITSEFFHKLPLTAAGDRKLTGYEYWIDNDYANKASKTLTPGQTIVDISGIDVSTLQTGLHNYHVRYKDDAGQWSSVVSEFFHKSSLSPGGDRKINSYEYWFDNDYASKVSKTVTPGQTLSGINSIDANALPIGLHNYHVRYKDDAGQWSSVASEFFHKLKAGSLGNNLITSYRYWFNRTESEMVTINLPTPVNPYELIKTINASTLAEGVNTIHFQFKDSNQAWSSVITDTITKSPMAEPGNKMQLTVFLEGAYNGTNLMSTTLNTNKLIPLSQPYSIPPWNFAGTEHVDVIPAGVVDWVLVEVRQASSANLATPSTILTQRAAFLKSDGSIVDLDGTSLLNIGRPTITNNIFVVVRHRNHLAIMSNTSPAMNGDTYTFNYTTGVDQAFGGVAGYKMIGVGANAKAAMVAGDIDAEGSIFGSDFAKWATVSGTTGVYNSSDLDFDGNIFGSDFAKWAINSGTTNPITKAVNVNPTPEQNTSTYSSQVPESKTKNQ